MDAIETELEDLTNNIDDLNPADPGNRHRLIALHQRRAAILETLVDIADAEPGKLGAVVFAIDLARSYDLAAIEHLQLRRDLDTYRQLAAAGGTRQRRKGLLGRLGRAKASA